MLNFYVSRCPGFRARLDLIGYRRLLLLVAMMAFIACEAGCAKKRDPIGREGLQPFILGAVDVGFKFDYELISYSSQIEDVENGGWGRISESLHEIFVIRVAEEDHEKILGAVKNQDRWRKHTGLRYTEENKVYAYLYSKGYVKMSMRSIAEVRDDSLEIEILFYDVNPVHLIH